MAPSSTGPYLFLSVMDFVETLHAMSLHRLSLFFLPLLADEVGTTEQT